MMYTKDLFSVALSLFILMNYSINIDTIVWNCPFGIFGGFWSKFI